MVKQLLGFSRSGRLARDEKGQAMTEYLLLLSIVVFIFVGVNKFFKEHKLGATILAPITGDFARTYRYGYAKTKGYDDGGPDMHPRAVGGNNFRIFRSDGAK